MLLVHSTAARWRDGHAEILVLITCSTLDNNSTLQQNIGALVDPVPVVELQLDTKGTNKKLSSVDFETTSLLIHIEIEAEVGFQTFDTRHRNNIEC